MALYNSKNTKIKISKKILYHIYLIRPPGRLLNFWALRVGAYSRWGTFSRTLILQGDCSNSCLVRVFWNYAFHYFICKKSYFLHDSLLYFLAYKIDKHTSIICSELQKLNIMNSNHTWNEFVIFWILTGIIEVQSINQSIYLRQHVGWGCPDHPSQRLMYKTHDKLYTTNICKSQPLIKVCKSDQN